MSGAAVRGKPISFDTRFLFRVATWNVLTLAKAGYTEAICQELSRRKVSIAGLTETRITGSGQSRVGDHTVIHFGEDHTHSRGVSLVLDKRLSRSLVSWQAVSCLLLTARFRHKHGHLSVVVVYAPTEDCPASDKDEFYTALQTLILSIPPHNKSYGSRRFQRRDGQRPRVLRGRYWSLRRRSYERQLFPPTYHVFILELGSPWFLVSA